VSSKYLRIKTSELTIIEAANSYWQETTGESFYALPGTAWIRLSTGKLCMNVGDGYERCVAIISPGSPWRWARIESPSCRLTENDLAGKLLDALELDEFYSMVARGSTYSLKKFPTISGTITLPSICNPCCLWDCAHIKPNEFCAIPTLKNLTLDDLYIGSWHGNLPWEILPTGWTWCAYDCFAKSFSNKCSVALIIRSAPMKTYIGVVLTYDWMTR
jgi:hypothetical protein